MIGALDALGIEATPMEHSFRGAAIWSRFDDGSVVEIYAYPTDIPVGEFSVTHERVIEGITVRHVDYQGGPTGDRFACAEVNYEVRGDAPPRFDDLDAFLAGLLVALGCVGADD